MHAPRGPVHIQMMMTNRKFLLRFYFKDKVHRETFIYVKKPVLFGTDPSCHVRLRSVNNTINPVHVIISYKEEKPWIEIKGETYINEFPQEINQIKELPLQHIIKVGSQKSNVRFELCPVDCVRLLEEEKKATVTPITPIVEAETVHLPPNDSREDSIDLLHMDEDSQELKEDDSDKTVTIINKRPTRSNTSLAIAPNSRKRSLSSFYRDLTK